MTRTRKYRWRKLIVLAMALACAGTWAASQVRSVRDRSEVAKMTEKMKTVCVGRFLIDVPVQADVSLSGETMDGFEIESIEEPESAFLQRVAAREADIEERGRVSSPKGPSGMVQARELRIPGMVGRVFVHGRTRSYRMEGERRIDEEWVSIDAYAHLGGLSFSLSMRFANESDYRAAELLLAQLRLRAENEVPAEAGFCIWRAMFLEPLPVHKTEHIVMHLGIPGHPDLGLSFATLPSNGTRGKSLLARVGDTDAAASADEMLRVTKLRARQREINGLPGEEVLERVRELNFTTGYNFMWETQGIEEDPLHPYVLLQMETGTNPRAGGPPIDSSLHEDALLALWDRISSSIRLRPSGPPPAHVPSPDEPSPKLGAVVRAGEACPQSGWWRCSDGGPGVDVQGGAVQYIRKGERMPQALLLPHQTMWQRLRGIQPSIEPAIPTSWKLVDKRQRPRTPAIVALAQAIPGEGSLDVQAGPGRIVSVGTHSRTGDPCPASAWWRCEEPHALDGARWFPRGSLLPAATFLVPRGLFGNSAGPDVIQRRSAWQLMRHAEAESVTQAANIDPVLTSDAFLDRAEPGTSA